MDLNKRIIQITVLIITFVYVSAWQCKELECLIYPLSLKLWKDYLEVSTRTLRVKAGSSFTITCDGSCVGSRADPFLRWYGPDKHWIAYRGPHSSVHVEQSYSRRFLKLHVRSATINNQGYYTCRGWLGPRRGWDTRSIRLIVDEIDVPPSVPEVTRTSVRHSTLPPTTKRATRRRTTTTPLPGTTKRATRGRTTTTPLPGTTSIATSEPATTTIATSEPATTTTTTSKPFTTTKATSELFTTTPAPFTTTTTPAPFTTTTTYEPFTTTTTYEPFTTTTVTPSPAGFVTNTTKLLPHNSSEKTCEEPNYKCGSGECLEKHQVCDTFPHCVDGSDERNCATMVCTEDMIACTDQSHCVTAAQICDGITQCKDGSDEDHDICTFN